MTRSSSFSFFASTVIAAASTVLHGDADFNRPIIPRLSATPTASVSTVPSNGDLNPYGVAFVPSGFPEGGRLSPGDILVSNFNASSNLQGTGTTIVRIDPSGRQSLFFQGQAGLGLTTALAERRIRPGGQRADHDAERDLHRNAVRRGTRRRSGFPPDPR